MSKIQQCLRTMLCLPATGNCAQIGDLSYTGPLSYSIIRPPYKVVEFTKTHSTKLCIYFFFFPDYCKFRNVHKMYFSGVHESRTTCNFLFLDLLNKCSVISQQHNFKDRKAAVIPITECVTQINRVERSCTSGRLCLQERTGTATHNTRTGLCMRLEMATCAQTQQHARKVFGKRRLTGGLKGKPKLQLSTQHSGGTVTFLQSWEMHRGLQGTSRSDALCFAYQLEKANTTPNRFDKNCIAGSKKFNCSQR